MLDLKTQLIKLGTTNPELRPHIREILGSVKGEYRWYELNPPSKGELESMTRVWGYISGIVKADVTGDVTQSHWIVIDVKSSGVLDMPNARAERELEKIALTILNDKYRGDWDIKVVDSKKHALKQASSAEDQKRMMRKTDPSTKVRKQMEHAKEMGLKKEDVLALVKVRPEEYTDLAIALGHMKAKNSSIKTAGAVFGSTNPELRPHIREILKTKTASSKDMIDYILPEQNFWKVSSEMREVTERDMQKFVANVQDMVDAYYAKMGYTTQGANIKYDKGGMKYYRVYREDTYKDVDGNILNVGSKSAFCFVDKATGDVFKPASWKTPAKHARGTIFGRTPREWGVNPLGANYLR